MPFRVLERDYKMEEEEELRLNVVDVYDLASEIGKEFEKIIECFGTDAVKGIMPRVINALEHLEKLTIRHERTDCCIQELKTTISHLEHEKIGKAEDRVKYERELEDIEDKLREESHELIEMVTRLQDENRKLSTSLQRSEEPVMSNGSTPDVDMKVVSRLQEVIESQRERLRKYEKEVTDQTSQLENTNLQLEKLTQSNRDLRRRQRNSANQMRGLIDERAELQAALQEEQRSTAVLRQRLGLAEKENEDLQSCSTEGVDLSNKLVFDRDDPNRPRFTMQELKEILYERNELKAHVSDLEDELQVFRPSAAHQRRSHIICPPLDVKEDGESSLSHTLTPPLSLSESFSSELQEVEDDPADPPVQGPMPYEPEDAPWKRGESGIRKFFRRLFGDSEVSPGGTPRRNLLTGLAK